jgi:hypothetical protein
MGSYHKEKGIVIWNMEAATGFEPVNNGFADRCLTTWLCRPGGTPRRNKMERETGFEPATSTLARLHSTTELFPLVHNNFLISGLACQGEK